MTNIQKINSYDQLYNGIHFENQKRLLDAKMNIKTIKCDGTITTLEAEI